MNGMRGTLFLTILAACVFKLYGWYNHMADTVFVDQTTGVVASWANDVNNGVYHGAQSVTAAGTGTAITATFNQLPATATSGQPITLVAPGTNGSNTAPTLQFGGGAPAPYNTPLPLTYKGSTLPTYFYQAGDVLQLIYNPAGPSWTVVSAPASYIAPTNLVTNLAFTDPANKFYGPTGVTVATAGSSHIAGDPFTVWDGSQYDMFFYTSVGGVVTTYRQSAQSLAVLANSGSPVQVTTLNNYHKMVVLVDVQNNPVQIGGLYHAYAVLYTGTNSSKTIYHFTNTSLTTDNWALGANVIPHGASGTYDGYFTDAPSAVWDGTTIRIKYMAAPDQSMVGTGYAEVMLQATGTNPNGPFTKNYTPQLLPSSNNTAWNYGWVGGTQTVQRPDGSYMLVANCGNTRPSGPGLEPNNSAIGFWYSASLDGPWTPDIYNPYATVTNKPTDGLEQYNVWRGNLVRDPKLGWWLFYNTGYTGASGEVITYARQGVYEYTYQGGNAFPGAVLNLTTSVQTVPNATYGLQPGTYDISLLANTVADSSMGTSPNINIDTYAVFDGTNYAPSHNRCFVGGYAYQNFDVETRCEYSVACTTAAPQVLTFTGQVTAGSISGSPQLRNIRLKITQR